jgi:endothelin-converting enzyme/putative endopeptidase
VRDDDLLALPSASMERFLDELGAGRHQNGTAGTDILREYYRRCISAAARDAGLTQLRTKLDAIARVQTLSELARALGELRASGLSALVGLDFVWGRRGVSANAVYAAIFPGAPLLPTPMYAAKHHLVVQQRGHWQRLAQLSGVISLEEVESALRIDAWLADPGNRDDAGASVVVHRADLERARFPWTAYLDGLGVPPDLQFGARHSSDLAFIDRIADLRLEDLKGYIRVLLVEVYAEYLGTAFVEEHQRFHIVIASRGALVAAPLPATCTILTARNLEPLLASAYLPTLEDPGSEAIARRMFEVLRGHFARTVSRATWMDPASREAAVAKVEAIGVRFIGDTESKAPDVSLSAPGSFLDAQLRLRGAESAQYLSMSGKPPVDHPLAPSLKEVAAYYAYYEERNAVWLSPVIVRPPYLRPGASNASSFGALGTTIGHELAHALTPSRRKIDAAGNYRETWSKESASRFEARARCLAYDFNAFVPAAERSGGVHRSTVDENVADLVGAQLALQALEGDIARAGPAGALSQARRDFFLTYAQKMCAFGPDHFSDEDAYRDPHSPQRARINGVVAKLPTFAATFSCPEGAPLAPRKRCELW